MRFVAPVNDFWFQFRTMSGLVARLDKSCLFTCGVARPVKEQLLSILVSRKAIFLLDVWIFLSSTRLKKLDCTVLAEKIAGKAKSWASKALFFLQVGSNWLIPSSLLCKCTGHLSSSFSKEWYARLRRSSSLFFGKVVSLIAQGLKFPGTLSPFPMREVGYQKYGVVEQSGHAKACMANLLQ